MRQSPVPFLSTLVLSLAPLYGQGILGAGYFSFFGPRPTPAPPGQIAVPPALFDSGADKVENESGNEPFSACQL